MINSKLTLTASILATVITMTPTESTDLRAQTESSTNSGKVDTGNTDIVDFDVRRNTILNQKTSIFLEDILVDDFTSLGKIGGSYIGASLLSNKDFVYLDLKEPSVSVGDRFAIYENRGPVKVPGEFNKETGTHIRLKGFAEVTKVANNSVVAQIYDASLHIEIGDSIAPLSEVDFVLAPKAPKKMIRGTVLAGVRDFSLISPHDFAFINRGSKNGLEVNDRLYVYRTAEGQDKVEGERAPMNVSELVVVHTGSRVATVYVMGSEDAFSAGASFKSAISEVQFLDGQQNAESLDSTSPTDTESDGLDLGTAADQAFASFGLGQKMPITRDGVQSPKFSFNLDFGGRSWKSPFYYTIYESRSAEIGWAPQYRMRLPIFEDLKPFYFYMGAGPTVTFLFDSRGRERVYYTQIGIQLHPEIRYLFDDQFFASAAPIVADIYFWKYINTGADEGNGIDVKSAFSSYLNIGMTF